MAGKAVSIYLKATNSIEGNPSRPILITVKLTPHIITSNIARIISFFFKKMPPI